MTSIQGTDSVFFWDNKHIDAFCIPLSLVWRYNIPFCKQNPFHFIK